MSSITFNFNSIKLILYTCSLLVIFCNAESVARPEKTVTPPQSILDLSSQDESAVGMMTTLEPIDSLDDISRDVNDDRCYKFDTCEDCFKSNCSWIVCLNYEFSCSDGPQELCPELSCSNVTTTTTTTTEPPTTTAPSNTTTTTPEPPVTTVPTTMNPNETTTASPTPTPTVTPTDAPTTEPPTTELPTTEPPTTILPTTDAPTTMPATTTPTTTVAPSPDPHSRHFDAASFVGGIILALTLTGVAFAGLKFYRKRVMESRYTNF